MTTMTLPRVVHARAPGKINVFMKVGLPGPDGHHMIATAYQAVSLYEEVRATLADDFEVRFTGPIDASSVPCDGSNLAIRAAKLLARRTGYRGGVHLKIEKHVPVAGGMGGASADAAATLLACDELWGTQCSKEDLLSLATKLGAEVPFALTGGTAIGAGRGDQLYPALAQGQFQWVLALADFGMSTPEVLEELDRHRDRHADIFLAQAQPTVETHVLQALRAGDPYLLAECLYSDLQAAALHLSPALAEVLQLGEENGALAGVICGSGPTVAFLIPDQDSAFELTSALSSAKVRVVHATGPVHGARLVSV